MGFSCDFHGDLSGTFMTFNGMFMGCSWGFNLTFMTFNGMYVQGIFMGV